MANIRQSTGKRAYTKKRKENVSPEADDISQQSSSDTNDVHPQPSVPTPLQ